MARWLLEHGATLDAGLAMGASEALNAKGMAFLAKLGAPLTDDSGNPLGPVAMVLETYSRSPKDKHEILEILVRCGYQLPDTPIMALHRGDRDRLTEFVRRDPQLLERRFTLEEIYPTECGCGKDGPDMHWTPIVGGTLLHVALDFHEMDIAACLLAQGADVTHAALQRRCLWTLASRIADTRAARGVMGHAREPAQVPRLDRRAALAHRTRRDGS